MFICAFMPVPIFLKTVRLKLTSIHIANEERQKWQVLLSQDELLANSASSQDILFETEALASTTPY